MVVKKSTNKYLKYLTYGLLLISAYFTFTWQHLHLGAIFNNNLVFGDDGDGFFNLWVLDHNRQYFFSSLQSWINGRIFFPDHEQTLLWSDILLVPSILYSLVFHLGFDRFSAYRLTVFIFSIIGYICVVFTLTRIALWLFPEKIQKASSFLFVAVFLFTLALVFSINLLAGYTHFQNHSWIGVLILLFSACGYSLTGKGGYLGLIFFVEASLFCTAPYFAVIGFILLSGCAVLLVIRDGWSAICKFLAHWKIWLPLLIFSFFPLMLYSQVSHLEYDTASISAELATNFQDFVVPSRGLVRTILENQDFKLPEINHESPAYLGAGFILLLICLPLSKRLTGAKNNAANSNTVNRLCLFIIICVIYCLVNKNSWLGYCMAWLTLSLFAYLLMPFFYPDQLNSSQGFLSSLFLLVTLLCIGFAIGPNPAFLDYSLNPSVYGLLEKTIPGVSNMRAIGRMSSLAQLFLGIWLFIQYYKIIFQCSRGKCRFFICFFVFCALVMQIIEAWPVKTTANQYHVDVFKPKKEDHKVLNSLKGSVAIFPVVPWHKNTYYMLYLSPYKEITLVNGYSARSTVFFDKLMALSNSHSGPTLEQLKLLKKIDCDFFLVHMRKVSKQKYYRLKKQYKLFAQTKKFAVFSLKEAQDKSTD